jgi:hypothetical protein
LAYRLAFRRVILVSTHTSHPQFLYKSFATSARPPASDAHPPAATYEVAPIIQEGEAEFLVRAYKKYFISACLFVDSVALLLTLFDSDTAMITMRLLQISSSTRAYFLFVLLFDIVTILHQIPVHGCAVAAQICAR